MADPKYAGLPGIASGQPDTYETTSEHEVEGDEDSDSDQSETLHLSSLSWLGSELEVSSGKEKETLIQKFTRLRCEVTEFCEELNSLEESAREGNLTGLYQQVSQLQDRLDVCEVDHDINKHAVNQNHVLVDLKKQLREISSMKTGDGLEASASYNLYLHHKKPLTAEDLAFLDKRLAALEQTLGPESNQRRVLSVTTDRLPLVDAVQVLDNRKYTLSPEHLSHVEGRLSALVGKMNGLNDQKDRVIKARSVSEVSKLFDALEDKVGIMNVLPEVYERLLDLKELHEIAKDWNSRSAEISADQGTTETLLLANRKLVTDTQSLLANGLQGVSQKLEALNQMLETI